MSIWNLDFLKGLSLKITGGANINNVNNESIIT